MDEETQQQLDDVRRGMVQEINSEPKSREDLEKLYGQVWNTQEMQKDFEPLSFGAPFIIVRKRDGTMKGSLMFQHSPRFYFNYQVYEPDAVSLAE